MQYLYKQIIRIFMHVRDGLEVF